MSPTHTRTCPKCGEQECRLAVQITTAGAQNVHLQCGKCAGLVPTRGGALWIPHKELEARGLAVDDLPVSRDDSRMTRCIHCGARGAEYHHWAAQAIFEDADAWPGDYLCQPCHAVWESGMALHAARVYAGRVRR